eukprot:XP_019078060.1 PREDICTED: putative nuclear RNA export factor SDE5 [Vitis vinifera]
MIHSRMEVSASSISEYDERKALEVLLDAFGSTFSLQEIAHAYCEAGRNADLAGEILYDMNGSTSTSTVHASNQATATCNKEVKDDPSSECYSNISEHPCPADGNPKASKPKRRPVSVGTISGVIGKSYARCTASANESCVATKPLKLDMTNFPMFECQDKEDKFDSAKDDLMHKDVEDFIFKMLGHGFQLDRGLIQEVLGKFSLMPSLSKLLLFFTDYRPKSRSLMGQRKSEYMTGDRRILNTKEPELPGEKGRRNLQKEVLAALFTTSERPEELPARTAKPRPVRKSRVAGNLVLEPFKDVEEYKIDDLFSKQIYEDDGEEDDSYQDLRQAVKEYRTTMKEYYKAAVNAFANGDRVKADKLLEKGHFFHNKAREADEESARKIFETRNVETEDEMSLDLHVHDAKEAILILKSHLSSLSGIPSIKFLKVIMETGEENISKGGARKRLIMKLLEKHSIKWTEGSNAGIILIRVDEINPQRLSFTRK